jgi:hypothetical protein
MIYFLSFNSTTLINSPMRLHKPNDWRQASSRESEKRPTGILRRQTEHPATVEIKQHHIKLKPGKWSAK